MPIQMRAASLAAIYGKHKKIENFDWDGLIHPPIAAYLSQKDIDDLRYIATSPRLGGTSKKKKFNEIYRETFNICSKKSYRKVKHRISRQKN